MTDQTNFGKVKEFHTAMETVRNSWPPSLELFDFRADLIREEFNELVAETYAADEWDKRTVPGNFVKHQIAKELADLLYVVYGTADAFGIDIDRVFAEVHRSNMSKLVDGKPLKREDGKVLKGPNYKPPNLDFVV